MEHEITKTSERTVTITGDGHPFDVSEDSMEITFKCSCGDEYRTEKLATEHLKSTNTHPAVIKSLKNCDNVTVVEYSTRHDGIRVDIDDERDRKGINKLSNKVMDIFSRHGYTITGIITEVEQGEIGTDYRLFFSEE